LVNTDDATLIGIHGNVVLLAYTARRMRILNKIKSFGMRLGLNIFLSMY
jgi:hypothetical protein